MSGARPHRHRLRVYYEDTDLAGIVYYANYLKYLERGRSEALRALGVDQRALNADTGAVFAVRSLRIDYRKPAHFDDCLEVVTALSALGGASVTLDQRIARGDLTLTLAEVRLGLVGPDGAPRRLPRDLRAAMGRWGRDVSSEAAKETGDPG